MVMSVVTRIIELQESAQKIVTAKPPSNMVVEYHVGMVAALGTSIGYLSRNNDAIKDFEESRNFLSMQTETNPVMLGMLAGYELVILLLNIEKDWGNNDGEVEMSLIGEMG